jgi:hypothetical protein
VDEQDVNLVLMPLPAEVDARLQREARRLGVTRWALIEQILAEGVRKFDNLCTVGGPQGLKGAKTRKE